MKEKILITALVVGILLFAYGTFKWQMFNYHECNTRDCIFSK